MDSELANSPEVRANKALTIDPSTFLLILSYTFYKDFLAFLTYNKEVPLSFKVDNTSKASCTASKASPCSTITTPNDSC